ncbi:UNVERIFIED_CONTAM: hypothetical protein GTU68_012685 [Idotea baltica]|nr:hypothetical protein [Idotea baltica]
MTDIVLQLSGIDRVYHTKAGDLPVLQGLDLTLKAGELVGLVGPSGSGKSTLLHSAGLLERPDAGDVILEGEDCYQYGERRRTHLRRNKIGFVYQFHHLLPEFNAANNIAMPLMIAGVSKNKASAKAMELLAEMGLADRGGHQPAQMSGGEQQRVAIARALANNPRLIIADEPTGNLDPATTERVFATLIRMARDEGVAVLIATHNMSLIRHMDRVVTLKNGKLIDYKSA